MASGVYFIVIIKKTILWAGLSMGDNIKTGISTAKSTGSDY